MATRAGEADLTVKELAAAAGRIGVAVELIKSIAYQTSLLAINATVEAAHAGDAGKGFAVVAQEVKALSAKTSDSIKEISSSVGQAQATTKNAIDAIVEISEIIGNIDNIATQVAKDVGSQAAATDEIAQSADHVFTGIQNISTAMHDITSSAANSEQHAEITKTASSQLSDQSRALARGFRDFLVTLRRGPFDNAVA